MAEAEVIAVFLRGELDSPRFGLRIRDRIAADGRSVEIVENPDTGSAADNAYRSGLLHGYRGVGGSAPLLETLPETIDWTRVALTPDELARVRYIDYPYWNELSAGTRSPVRAVERIRAGVTAMDRPNDPFVVVAARICAGESLGPVMLVAPDPESPLVILEGHTRVTGMLLRPDCLPGEIEVIVGYSPGIRDWMFHGPPEADR